MNIRLTNHIAYRFLNDPKLTWELMELHFPELMHQKDVYTKLANATKEERDTDDRWAEITATYQVLCNSNNTNYYITDSVTDKLSLLKVNRKEDGAYDYTIFKHLPSQKCTFILPNNKLVRILITETDGDKSQIVFEYIKFTFDKELKDKNNGVMNSCMFYVNRITGKQCSHFKHSDVKEIEDYLYKLLCFVFLSETEEIILKAGEKIGTKKSGKIINEIKHPLIIVNSKWNITSIRTDGFAVSGHFRLQPYGEGRKQVRVQWIDPFEKKGYIRTAQKELVN